MWIRIRFDIGWHDIYKAWVFALFPCSRKLASETALETWGEPEKGLVTLSVRSAFDLLLRALQLPPGSEVLMSALTVPDMVTLVHLHGLVPVPVDINEQGEMLLESLRANISSKSRMLVVAHLFGGCTDLTPIAAELKNHNILLVEDCAQSFKALGEQGKRLSHVNMHSFGPIKTATALGGAVISVTDSQLLASMRNILQQDPIQTRFAWMQRLLRFTLLKGLTSWLVSRIFFQLQHLLRIDHDRFTNSLAKSFHAQNILQQIRKQPCSALLQLLVLRWKTYDFSRIAQRQQLGEQLDQALAIEHSRDYTYWVYIIFVPNASLLAQILKDLGFDATTQSRMVIVPSPDGLRRASHAEAFWPQALFLPWYVELPNKAVLQMGEVISRIGAGSVCAPNT